MIGTETVALLAMSLPMDMTKAPGETTINRSLGAAGTTATKSGVVVVKATVIVIATEKSEEKKTVQTPLRLRFAVNEMTRPVTKTEIMTGAAERRVLQMIVDIGPSPIGKKGAKTETDVITGRTNAIVIPMETTGKGIVSFAEKMPDLGIVHEKIGIVIA
jgi:hypothetical protein